MNRQTNLETPSPGKSHRPAGRMIPVAVAESSTFRTGKTRGAKVGVRILSLLLCLSRQTGQLSQAAKHSPY